MDDQLGRVDKNLPQIGLPPDLLIAGMTGLVMMTTDWNPCDFSQSLGAHIPVPNNMGKFSRKLRKNNTLKIKFRKNGTGTGPPPRKLTDIPSFSGGCRYNKNIWVFPKMVGFPPKSSNFNGGFHYKSSILGAHPYFWKHPNINQIIGAPLHLGQQHQGASDTVLPALGLSRSRGVLPASSAAAAGGGHGLWFADSIGTTLQEKMLPELGGGDFVKNQTKICLSSCFVPSWAFENTFCSYKLLCFGGCFLDALGHP